MGLQKHLMKLLKVAHWVRELLKQRDEQAAQIHWPRLKMVCRSSARFLSKNRVGPDVLLCPLLRQILTRMMARVMIHCA
jgi:hypothetical protein